MGFYPTVNSRFAKTDGESLRVYSSRIWRTPASFPPRAHAFQILPQRFLRDSAREFERTRRASLLPPRRSRSSHTNRITAACLPGDGISRYCVHDGIRIGPAVKSPQAVPTTSIKPVRETHTGSLESLTRVADRAMSRPRALRASRYSPYLSYPESFGYCTTDNACIFIRLALVFIACIRGLLLYASRFRTANAFMHVSKSRFRIGKHATRHYWNHSLMPPLPPPPVCDFFPRDSTFRFFVFRDYDTFRTPLRELENF